MDDQNDSRDPIADYIEWTKNRYNPGYFLGGTIRPELRKARLSPRGRRLSAALLAIKGLMSLALSIEYLVAMSFSWDAFRRIRDFALLGGCCDVQAAGASLKYRGLICQGGAVRKILMVLCVATSLCASLGCTTDVRGPWNIKINRDTWTEPMAVTCTFTQPHSQLRVECPAAQFVSAKLEGRHFSWQFTSGDNQSIATTFSGEFKDGAKALEGTWQFVESSDNTSGGGTFQATGN